MSTKSRDNIRIHNPDADISEHAVRFVAAMAAAGFLLGTVIVLDLPVALLSGLFVPLSLAAESGVRARAADTSGPHSEFRRTGFGVLVGAAVTGVVVFVAVAL